jgi:hypothetical protein
MKKSAIILLLCMSTSLAFAQTVVASEDILIDTHNMNDLGEELIIKQDENTPLAAGSYICNYGKKGNVYPITFTIGKDGKPDGTVECTGYFKTWVSKGIIQRFESYLPETGKLKGEEFMRGDTLIKLNYNRHGQIRSEYRYLNKENIYDYNCSFNGETDSLGTCHLYDNLNGIYIAYYEGGRIESKKVSKGLPKDIKETTEAFDEKGKLTSKETVYTNGNVKNTNADGSYSITTTTDGIHLQVKEYNKAGELMKSYEVTAAMPTMPSED